MNKVSTWPKETSSAHGCRFSFPGQNEASPPQNLPSALNAPLLRPKPYAEGKKKKRVMCNKRIPGFVLEFALSVKSPGLVPEFTLSAKSPEFALSAKSQAQFPSPYLVGSILELLLGRFSSRSNQFPSPCSVRSILEPLLAHAPISSRAPAWSINSRALLGRISSRSNQFPSPCSVGSTPELLLGRFSSRSNQFPSPCSVGSIPELLLGRISSRSDQFPSPCSMLTWSSRPRALGQLARRHGRRDAGSRSGTGARLTARMAGVMERYDGMITNKEVRISDFIVDSNPSTVATSASSIDGTNEISTDLPTSADTVAATLISFLSPEQRNLGRLPSLQPRQRSGTLAPAVSGPANAALANAP
ncbi:hypothetical protein BHM03_00045614 [Ensete ventricosum]|nr:hypothetical protein BHM03_00045614 [Ensete ventricosum]